MTPNYNEIGSKNKVILRTKPHYEVFTAKITRVKDKQIAHINLPIETTPKDIKEQIIPLYFDKKGIGFINVFQHDEVTYIANTSKGYFYIEETPNGLSIFTTKRSFTLD